MLRLSRTLGTVLLLIAGLGVSVVATPTAGADAPTTLMTATGVEGAMNGGAPLNYVIDMGLKDTLTDGQCVRAYYAPSVSPTSFTQIGINCQGAGVLIAVTYALPPSQQGSPVIVKVCRTNGPCSNTVTAGV